jgi:hypothetical protein
MERQRLDDTTFEREHKVIEMFVDNAKTYVQLSIGALFLSVTFFHEILGVAKEAKLPTDWLLILSWCFFLAAVIAGALYQYFAAKFLEWKSGVERTHRGWPQWLIMHPWPCYTAMLVAFFLGGIFFTVTATMHL